MMKNRDFVIDSSALIIAFIRFDPWQRSFFGSGRMTYYVSMVVERGTVRKSYTLR